MSKTSESKGRIDKAILKAAPIIVEVEKSGKNAEKTLKAEQVGEEAIVWTRHICAFVQWQWPRQGKEIVEHATLLS